MTAKRPVQYSKDIDYEALFLEMANRRYREMAEEALRRAEEQMYEEWLDRQLYGPFNEED